MAIYLPNSIEYLATLFACSFYGLTAILLPFDEPEETVVSTLRRSAADAVVTAPGMFPFDTVVRSYPALRQLIWVVDEGSRHMDWNEVPKGMGGAVNVATWQEILADGPADAGYELPASNSADEAKNIITFWKTGKPGQLEEMVRFTHGHLVAGVAAQLAAIPQSQRLTPADLFLPAAPLSHAYTLVLTLAALYSNASVALNSAAARAPDLAAATTGISPTVIVATPRALANTHAAAIRGRMASSVVRVSHWLQTRALVRDGVMPAAGLLSRTADAVLRPELGIEPGKLRLVFVAERAGTSQPTTASARPDGGDDEDVQPQLSSRVLSDLRVCLGARIVYALTAAKVAGAVAQTAIYDYRVFGDANDGRATHFGAPTTATEVFLRDTKQHRTTDEVQEGEACLSFYFPRGDPLV